MSAVLTQCGSCDALWDGERRTAGWAPQPGPGVSLLHPLCPKDHRARGTDARSPGDFLPPGMGPVLATALTHDPGLGLWMSDVAVTPPTGADLQQRAIVAGAVAEDPQRALLLGWTEALERRCTLARPRGPVRLAAYPKTGAGHTSVGDTPQWQLEGRRSASAEPVWLPYEQVVHHSVLQGQGRQTGTDSTGVAAYPDPIGARVRAVRECIERAGLALWWSEAGSVRCALHTEEANSLLRQSSLVPRAATADVWHTYRAGHHVAGCLITTATNLGPYAVFGSGAHRSVDAAIHAAFGEALQLHLTRVLVVDEDQRPAYSRRYIGKALPASFAAAFREAFPLQDQCVQTDFGDEMTAEDPAGTTEAVEVDCGDALTDGLGLSVIRVVLPSLPRFSARTTAPGGLNPDFLGV
ncbi:MULTISPECIES: YcaO-like family protein [unclassified Streptomyces]|uniref:YcaO-like family protein n=1 Tax=unclassified Streptomyces TaxID=2593676 RepID=UPI00099C0E03|nr:MULTISPECIES: YcaO-like family protein [unclassified Streptomyces]